MTAAEAGVRPLRRGDGAAAANVLADSHAGYPAFRHLWPDAATRRRALLPFLRASTADAAALSAGTVATDRDGVLAVALWLPPGTFPWSPLRQVRAGPALLRTALADPRAFPAFARLGAAAARTLPSPSHWYLEALGVAPRAQRRGWGRRVLRPGLERADAASLPCYVETCDQGNEAFYGRLGFMVVGARHEHLPGGPPYTGMERLPRPRAATGEAPSR